MWYNYLNKFTQPLEEAQQGGYLNPLSLSTMRIMAGLLR
nr:MAG TPA: hypothetical protein [Caudoviricetes sp.]